MVGRCIKEEGGALRHTVVRAARTTEDQLNLCSVAAEPAGGGWTSWLPVVCRGSSFLAGTKESVRSCAVGWTAGIISARINTARAGGASGKPMREIDADSTVRTLLDDGLLRVAHLAVLRWRLRRPHRQHHDGGGGNDRCAHVLCVLSLPSSSPVRLALTELSAGGVAELSHRIAGSAAPCVTLEGYLIDEPCSLVVHY